MEVHSQMVPLIGWDLWNEIRLTLNPLLRPLVVWNQGCEHKIAASHLLKEPAKHLCNVCFSVMSTMSVSISFQISDSHFRLKKVEKVKGGRSLWGWQSYQQGARVFWRPCLLTWSLLSVARQLQLIEKEREGYFSSHTHNASCNAFEFCTAFALPLGFSLGWMHHLSDRMNHQNKYLLNFCLISIQHVEHDANNPPLTAQFVPYYQTLRAIYQRGLNAAADNVFVCLNAFRAKCLQSVYSRHWRVSVMWPIRCDLASSSVRSPSFNEGTTCFWPIIQRLAQRCTTQHVYSMSQQMSCLGHYWRMKIYHFIVIFWALLDCDLLCVFLF